MALERSGTRELTLHCLAVWAAGKRGYSGPPPVAGYPPKTLEYRLRDEGGHLISGQGLKLDQSDDTFEVVDWAVEQLPPELHQAIVLRWLEGRTNKSAAERLRVSRQTYARRLEQAHDMLAGILLAKGLIV